MIPVEEQTEPINFNQEVRVKGLESLKQVPHPKDKGWKGHEHWRKSLRDLYDNYKHTCAYSALWMPWSTSSPEVDHFIPKSVNPDLAYEWSNFRLSSRKMNTNKSVHQDILDPFSIQYGWFILDFPSLLIKANSNLDVLIHSQVENTIKRLKLNSDDRHVQHRQGFLMHYCTKDWTFEYLKKAAPFIAYELERQNLVDSIAAIMSTSKAKKD